ncbi:ATP-dependent DNA helicase 2 subunit 1 isoform X2 [Hetaerina americana]|uniref:ATP-dependent DNA helicase 2 subunit 1 isoform X2 n=1 Tax=Hetaerina americana TaxID=62018 RepID=UPI003A7F1EBE
MSDISDEEDEVHATGREGIIFLIDATESMFSEDDSGNCAFKQSLKACDNAMMHKVKFSDNDLMGFILFGTDVTRNDGERSHISVLKGLQRPCSDTVRELRKMHESSIGDFGSKFGHNEDYLFADVLWLAQSMFSKHARNLVSSRIILLSSSKRFGKDDNHSQRQAKACANDLHGHLISMDFVPCIPEYKPTDFISAIMQIVRGNDEPWTVPRSHAINSLEDLPGVVESVVESTGEHARYFAHLNFCIGGKVSVGVEIYNLMRAYGGPKKEKLCRVTNKKVSSKVVHQVSAVEAKVDVEGEDEDSFYEVADAPSATVVEREQIGVDKADLDKSLHIGGETVRFTQEEFEMFYKIVDPGLVLLGFVPVDLLKITHHSGPASLVYPSRSSSSGSRDLFTALWHRMGEKNVAAVCTCTLRKRSLTRFAALVPSGLKKDNKVYDEYKKYGIHAVPEPQGFHIFYFPFTGRDIKYGKTEGVSENQRNTCVREKETRFS